MFPEDAPVIAEAEPTKDPELSDLVKEALVTTGRLWSRHGREVGTDNDAVDKRHSTFTEKETTTLTKSALAKKSKSKLGPK